MTNLSKTSFPIVIDGITIDYYCEGSGGENGIDLLVGDWGMQIPLESSDQVIAAIVRARVELQKRYRLLPSVEPE